MRYMPLLVHFLSSPFLWKGIISLVCRCFGACPVLHAEMGIYRDNFLSIIVIAQNSLDLSITVIAFVIYFVIADKLSR